MPPKKKTLTKVSLNAFLADDTTGSWADESLEIPTAPAASSFGTDSHSAPVRFSSGGDRRSDQRSGGFAPSRGGDSRPPRAQNPLPSAPPYSAFFGNLNHSVTDQQVSDLLVGLQVFLWLFMFVLTFV